MDSGMSNPSRRLLVLADIDANVIETYRQLAKFNFDCGDYQTAKDMLSNIVSLSAMPPISKGDDGSR